MRADVKRRNPVFALEMIQTSECCGRKLSRKTSQSSIRPGDDSDDTTQKVAESDSTDSRNPVFALEMIQTKKRASFSRGENGMVAIQYSPWR